ncbi:MAG: hypothetical protein ABSB99_06580 [Acidimicrobiales bacterium]|jgi:glutathione-regulated potassium-efflux system ancillary protein KefG
MGRRVDVDDLVDTMGVARLLGLTHRNSVSTYLTRYPDMPRPVIDIPESRTRLWLRSEIIAWDKKTRSGQPSLFDSR